MRYIKVAQDNFKKKRIMVRKHVTNMQIRRWYKQMANTQGSRYVIYYERWYYIRNGEHAGSPILCKQMANTQGSRYGIYFERWYYMRNGEHAG